MRKIIIFINLFFISTIFSLEKAPWFGNIYELYFLSKYTYSYYHKVDEITQNLHHRANYNQLYFDLSLAPSSTLDIDCDLEFVSTTFENFNFSTSAIQTRYLIKDDIASDPFSLYIGGNIRYVSSDTLKDISNLYHSNFEIELSSAIGKEFCSSDTWFFRFWAYGLIGQADKGFPWMKEEISIESNFTSLRKLSVFLTSMQCFGNQKIIDPFNFDGYANIQERNLDLGVRLGFNLSVWGTLSFEYKRRLVAILCPKDQNFFSISYLLPFSF